MSRRLCIRSYILCLLRSWSSIVCDTMIQICYRRNVWWCNNNLKISHHSQVQTLFPTSILTFILVTDDSLNGNLLVNIGWNKPASQWPPWWNLMYIHAKICRWDFLTPFTGASILSKSTVATRRFSKDFCSVVQFEILEPSMDRTKGNTCLCGRAFSHTSALSNHIRSCQKTKKRLSGALDKAREVWSGRKRRRLGLDHEEPSTINQPSLSGLVSTPHPVTPVDEVMHTFIHIWKSSDRTILTCRRLLPKSFLML